MKTQRIVAAIAAASLTLSGGAFAQTSGVQETRQAAGRTAGEDAAIAH